MLDRERYYAIVYGDPVAKYMQDGIFYRGNGHPVDSKEPAKPSPKPVHKAAVVEQKAPAPITEDQEATLKGMHISKLKKLAVKVAEATNTDHPELKGKGLKANLIAYIAENTE